MRKLLWSLLMLLPGAVSAATVVVTWTPPVRNTDGSSIPASGPGSLVSARVEYGTCSGGAFGTKTGEQVVPVPANSVELQGFLPGLYCFRVYAKNTYGNESAASNVQSRTLDAPTPEPPVLGAVSVAAFEVTQKGGQIRLGRQIGTAPIGTECFGSTVVVKNGRQYYQVDADAVDLTRKPRSVTLVMHCAWS